MNCSFKISQELFLEIKEAVNNNPDLYANFSHFIRSAVIEKLRKERGVTK